LIAAISTEGFKQLYTELDTAVSACAGDPKRQLQEGVWAYVQFALQNADTFKIMFSGALEQEREYPAFVEISHRTFERVTDVVRACQDAEILRPGPAEVLAVGVWGQVHGIILLMLAGQISHTVLDRFNISEIVFCALGQILIA
jgi:AcrR family transcriptional regulator